MAWNIAWLAPQHPYYFQFPSATKRWVQLWHQYKLSFKMEWKNSKSQWTWEFSSRDDVIYKNRHPLTEAETWVNKHTACYSQTPCMNLQCMLLIAQEKSFCFKLLPDLCFNSYTCSIVSFPDLYKLKQQKYLIITSRKRNNPPNTRWLRPLQQF